MKDKKEVNLVTCTREKKSHHTHNIPAPTGKDSTGQFWGGHAKGCHCHICTYNNSTQATLVTAKEMAAKGATAQGTQSTQSTAQSTQSTAQATTTNTTITSTTTPTTTTSTSNTNTSANTQTQGEQVVLVTAGYDHLIKIWQAHSGVCLRSLQYDDSQVNALGITPDKKTIAACGYQYIRLYDINDTNPDPFMSYDGNSKNISRLGFQEDGKWMYTGGEDCTARLWDLRMSLLQCQRIFMVSAPVTGIALHPNQAEIVIGDQSGVIHLWDLRTDENEQLIPQAETSILDVAIDNEGKLMAAVNNVGNCYVWSLNSTADQPTKLSPKHKISVHSEYTLRCKFSPDSSLLVTTSADWTAKVWSTKDFSLVREFKYDSQRWVWDAAFSADSQYVFTGSSDGFARLWNINTGTIEREYSGHSKPITALAFKDEII